MNNYNSDLRAQQDIEEIMKDPSLDIIRAEVAGLISDHERSAARDLIEENTKFIRDALSDNDSELKLKSEISEIKYESNQSRINELTAEWVNEWHRKKQSASKSLVNEERENFIVRSLKSEDQATVSPEPSAHELIAVRNRKVPVIRYISLTAAAVVGLFITISVLTPSHNPDKIFSSYYEPFNPASSVTRGDNGTDHYNDAVGYYKAGDFSKAAEEFSVTDKNDPRYSSTLFYMGLTNIETGDFKKAVYYLNEATLIPNEFSKETKWYLALALLKNGDSKKAAEYFRELSSSDGHYRERAEKILRRLK